MVESKFLFIPNFGCTLSNCYGNFSKNNYFPSIFYRNKAINWSLKNSLNLPTKCALLLIAEDHAISYKILTVFIGTVDC